MQLAVSQPLWDADVQAIVEPFPWALGHGSSVKLEAGIDWDNKKGENPGPR